MKTKYTIAFIVFILLIIFDNNSLIGKTWVFIDDDGTHNYAEGYYIQEFGLNAVTKGGDLTSLLQSVLPDDYLILVCHGLQDPDHTNRGWGFKWGGVNYEGFGFGNNRLLLPAHFSNMQHLLVLLDFCFSNNDPDGDGPDSSLTLKLFKAMGDNVLNTVNGFNNCAGSTILPIVKCRPCNRIQVGIMYGILADYDDEWTPFLPAFNPPYAINQMTKLQELFDWNSILNGKANVSRIKYFPSVDKPCDNDFFKKNGCECCLIEENTYDSLGNLFILGDNQIEVNDTKIYKIDEENFENVTSVNQNIVTNKAKVSFKFIKNCGDFYWDLSNLGGCQASIPKNSDCDSVELSAGNNAGSCVLYLYDGSDNQIVDSIQIRVNSCPPLFSISGPRILGIGTIGTYSTTSSDTGISYTWSLVDAGAHPFFTTSPDSSTVQVNAGMNPGRFFINLHGSNGSCDTTIKGGSVEVTDPSPVELVSFTYNIKRNKVTLNWQTAGEINNSGFDIERSDVQSQMFTDWIKIGFVEGNGTTNAHMDYSHEDNRLMSGKHKYRLKQIDYNGNFEYFDLTNEVVIGTPEKFSLSQNYPNPFNPVTKIDFDLPSNGKVKLIVFDNLGREVKTILNEFRDGGYYTEEFGAGNLPSGVYFYRIEAEKYVSTKKMLLLK